MDDMLLSLNGYVKRKDCNHCTGNATMPTLYVQELNHSNVEGGCFSNTLLFHGGNI